ncbi:MAG: sulfite exporter TauE/SafE family protein [Spirochaetaceae bacterium]|jgi:sulfite exporter TauE/SafE/copper chaperone CopZ/plastocyanin domain-containing protein|nr:sulfite exporter TauE/SafE family protein [Spirochaetaceae bacterium]
MLSDHHTKNIQSRSFSIGGMTCVSCQNRIEGKLKHAPGIEQAQVDFRTGKADLTWDGSIITAQEIQTIIEGLDYQVLDKKARTPVVEIIGTLVIILALYVLVQGLGLASLSAAFPLAEAGMSYGLVALMGLLTSVHCVAMCGGINLSQCMPAAAPQKGNPKKALAPAALYNGGRVLSYTAMGVLVGALGQVLSPSGQFQGMVQLAAGVFMVIMGINMLGFFRGALGTLLRRLNLQLPAFFTRKLDTHRSRSKSPLIIGLLNGLMPCGPLQAMQLYALSTGSPVAGGLSMLLFSLGTVPLMFGIGALGSLLRGIHTRRVMRFGAILVTVMGMTMATYGLALSGFSFDGVRRKVAYAPQGTAEREGASRPATEGGVQVLNSTLTGGRYPAITVQQGIPVKWTITAPPGSINGCNNRMIIREYGIEHQFTSGENVIEFTPERVGKFPYSCWMGMIRSSITVLAPGESALGASEEDTPAAPSPAGVLIPVEQVALAEIQEGIQKVAIHLKDDGIEPALILVQRGVPTLWTVTKDSLDPGNNQLIFPAYYTQMDLIQGDNLIQLIPTADFDFSTGDNVFYGYVKVVDDVGAVNMEAIKAEVSAFETLIYPESYFAQGPGGE